MIENSEVVEGTAEPEKSLSQSQVNEIVKREKLAASDRTRREMEASYAQQLERQRSSQNIGMGGMEVPPELEEKIFNRMLERANAMDAEEQAKAKAAHDEQIRAQLKKVSDNYFFKMEAGSKDFPDFEEVMKDFEPGAFPQLAFLAAEMDNTAAIMYELSKNPDKLARLDGLAEKSPKLARRELEKLSQSIAQNQQAVSENASTNPPLSRLKSSPVGADNGKMGLKDFKNADWLRG